jgi:AcrR family transcriptional regulator
MLPIGRLVVIRPIAAARRETVTKRENAARKPLPRKRAADRIRESARELFYRQGTRAVGVEEIVTRAGVTKPSLYRSFPSKDELIADYLRHMGEEYLARFDAVMAANPSDPRGQFHFWLEELLQLASKPDYRGCGTTNAAVEYPDRKHPARKVATDIKSRFRARLTVLAKSLGAGKPDRLGDALLLLLEGVYSSGQLFGPDGPARVVIEAADDLVECHLSRSRA